MLPNLPSILNAPKIPYYKEKPLVGLDGFSLYDNTINKDKTTEDHEPSILGEEGNPEPSSYLE